MTPPSSVGKSARVLRTVDVGECARLLLEARGVEDGVRSVLRLLGEDLGAAAVTVVLPGDGEGRLAWRAVTATAADDALTPWLELPLEAHGRMVGRLQLRGEAGGAVADDRHGVAGVAALLALVLGQDERLRALEGELSARVAELAEQRAFMECVVDSLPVGLYVVDRDYRIHAWNSRRESGLQGVARSDALGRTIFEVLNRQPAAMLKAEFDQVFATGLLEQFQMESRAFGAPRSYRISKIPMRRGDGPVTHVITVGEDITDWKAAQDRMAQAEKLAALGQLAAGVMHEINNPLATIAACAESIALHAEAGAGIAPPELLRIIDLEVQRCKGIVDGLLDFARPKPACRIPCDVNGIVRRALFLLKHHPRFRRVRVRPLLDEARPLQACGDEDQLVQVVIALAMNALDATPEGGEVRVATRSGVGPGGSPEVEMALEDEGPGIPRAMQAKVFEPFFTTKPTGQGTGLGLAICYGIVQDHGGRIEVESVEGAGATFRVRLPAVAGP
ncbi:MAG: PAS domain-containing protein [Gemmatimonadetes bacterium]|nr:PAS domain-containing protein [Gemmatimonadota bacterium]